MIITTASENRVQHFPADLRPFGLTPFGDARYRCVWSESRLHQIGGRFPNGVCEYRWVPLYPVTPLTPPCWTLEKWLSAIEFAGPRALWDAQKDEHGMLPCGPYPAMGEYDHCYSFRLGGAPVTISMIESVIRMVEAGRIYKPGQKRAAIVQEKQASQDAWLARGLDIWRDSQGAFNNRASNINPAKRTAEKVDLSRTSPLPVSGDGKPFAL